MGSVNNMIQNNEGNGVRGGGRGRGLRGLRAQGGARKLDWHPRRGSPGMRDVRGPGGRFSGVRKLDGHPCQGPPGMRGVRGPGGRFSGVRKLDGHPCRGPLGMRGERGIFRGARQLDGHPCRGPLGRKGVRGPGGRFKDARRLDVHLCRGFLGMRGVRGRPGAFRGARQLDGHPCRGPLGVRGVRVPGGTFRGARQLDGHLRRGPLGIYVITKTMRGTRNVPWQNSVLEDRFKAVGSSGVESRTKLQVSNLNVGVSNEDIRRLFSRIGELIRYGIHYDKDGNPCGSAEVVFARSSDAFQAERYNNTDLDGKPMKIEKVRSVVRAHVASRLNMISGANGRRARGVCTRGRGGRGHGGLGGRAVEKSAEELDKELENYEAETRQT